MHPLLAALDVDAATTATTLAERLRGHVGGFKVGSHLFTAEGPPFVRALTALGDRVFLDLKYHDIPNTVASAVRAAARMGVWMLNVHASGGRGMMRAARDAARQADSDRIPLVIAVTVLTSFDGPSLADVGIERQVIAHVEHLALLAQDAGLDGVVASPRETGRVRERCGPDFLIVTPGIRSGPPKDGDDQVRTMTAADAVLAGANYLVVGRPIIAAPDPAAAADAIAATLPVSGATGPLGA
jgi:orotidine-5'-phosphate decarboxylase